MSKALRVMPDMRTEPWQTRHIRAERMETETMLKRLEEERKEAQAQHGEERNSGHLWPKY